MKLASRAAHYRPQQIPIVVTGPVNRLLISIGWLRNAVVQ